MPKIMQNYFQKLKRNGIVSNMLASGTYKPIAMLLSYIYVRFVLSYLGVEKYGVWSTILTLISWINYFDIGIGNGLKNRLTEALEKNDRELCKKYIASSYIIISAIVMLVCLIFCGISLFVPWKTVLKVEDIEENLHIIICFSFFFLSINFILQTCKSILFAFQKAALVSQMELTQQALGLLGLIILRSVSNGNILYVALLYGFSILITNIIYTVIAFKESSIIPSINDYDKRTGISLTHLGLKFFIIQLCALILFTTDNLLISYLFGAMNVTPYNTVIKAFQAIFGIHSAFITPIWPAVVKAKAEGNYRRIQNMTRNTSKMTLPFCAVAIVLALIFRPVSYLWLGQEIEYSNLLIFLGCAYCILTMISNTFASISNGLELMHQSIILALIQAVGNIPLSIFFAKTMGLEAAGVMLGTVVSIGIAAVGQPIIVYKHIKSRDGRNHSMV